MVVGVARRAMDAWAVVPTVALMELAERAVAATAAWVAKTATVAR